MPMNTPVLLQRNETKSQKMEMTTPVFTQKVYPPISVLFVKQYAEEITFSSSHWIAKIWICSWFRPQKKAHGAWPF